MINLQLLCSLGLSAIKCQASMMEYTKYYFTSYCHTEHDNFYVSMNVSVKNFMLQNEG